MTTDPATLPADESPWDLTDELAAALNIHFETPLPTAIQLRSRLRAPIKVTPARTSQAA